MAIPRHIFFVYSHFHRIVWWSSCFGSYNRSENIYYIIYYVNN